MKNNAAPVLDPASAEEAYSCVVENVARILAEEPRLEAVAFEAKTRKLAMAILGADTGERLAKRVADAVNLPGNSRCGVADADGSCSQCGAQVGARTGAGRHGVVVKQVLGNTLIEKQTCSTAIHFWRWQALRWPKFVPRKLETPAPHAADEWKTLALQATGCLAAGLAGLAAEKAGAPGGLTLACWLGAYLLGAWEAAEETWEKIRAGALDVHFLMLAVALGAAAIGAWHEGALLLFLFSASGAMEHYAMDRTQKEIGALLNGAPQTATVLAADGSESEMPVADLVPGLIVRITGGQHVPVDLRITKGRERVRRIQSDRRIASRAKSAGRRGVLAGTLNLHGLLEARVLRPASESALQKVIALIENAQKMRAPAQRFTDRFGTDYTYGVLGLCTAMFFVWWLALHLPAFVSAPGAPHSAFYRAMTLLVVASPCALVLSIPSAILSAIAFGARRGILFRGGAALEALAKVDVVALDKTGTLTGGELQLTKVQMFAGLETDLHKIAYNLARFSDHPLSRAIKRHGQAGGLPLEEPENFESLPGQGLRATFGYRPFVLGRQDLLAGCLPAGCEIAAAEDDGTAEVFVGGTGLAGRLIFRDAARPESAGLLAGLQARTRRNRHADRRPAGTAERLAGALGDRRGARGIVARAKTRRHPGAEARRSPARGDDRGWRQRCAQPRRRGYQCGDGRPRLGCGARTGGGDSDERPAGEFLRRLRSQPTDRPRHPAKPGIALGTVVLMVPCGLAGVVPLALGVAAHEGSTVIVVLNSLRLLFSRRPPQPAASSLPTPAL